MEINIIFDSNILGVSTCVQKHTGNGGRFIILYTITSSGWVSDTKLVFKSTKKTGDYHGQMNWDLFKKWFTEMLLPIIPKHSLIIMDNAAYHNILSKNNYWLVDIV